MPPAGFEIVARTHGLCEWAYPKRVRRDPSAKGRRYREPVGFLSLELYLTLKGVLQSKLNHARADRRGVDHPELAVGGICTRIAKLRVIEGVEKFGAEL
jgi:hypothetical protein